MEYAFSYFSEALNKDLDIVCELTVHSDDEWDFEITNVFDSDDESLDYEGLPSGERNKIHRKAKFLAADYKNDVIDEGGLDE